MTTVTGRTIYSEDVKGARVNYGWSARFDLTDGTLGITQKDGGSVKDRVLLSPHQVNALLAFIGRRK